MKKLLSKLILFALIFITAKVDANTKVSGYITADNITAATALGSSSGNLSLATLIAKPTINSFTPNSGGSVTITGTNFTGATAVSFGGVPADYFNVQSSTLIYATPGAGASGNIQVVTPGGTATAGGFTYLPKPTITSFTPSAGNNNTVVDVYGTNFTNVTNAFIAEQEASFYVVSPTQVRVIVGSIDPENTNRSGKVAVSTLGGMAISTTDFTYIPPPEITSFSPSTGSPGDTVTIIGSDFTGLNFVAFGDVPATSFTLISPTSIKAVVGSGATGKIHVVTNGGSAFSATNFTHTTPASITSFSPTTGTDGDIVTITGVNLSSVNSVRIGGVMATSFKVTSPTTISAVVGPGASGKISVNAGNGFVYSAADFTFVSKTSITSFSPTSGVPGDRITITGTYFNYISGVNFGGVPAASYTFPTSSFDTLLVTLGQGASGKISVNTPAGLIESATNFTFLQAPAITSFTPATAAQGDTITITGANFTGATKVMFGTAPPAYFNVTSPTSILAKVVSDSGMGGKVPISVTTPYGTTSSATKFTILSPPTVQSFTPSSGGRDTQISITGNHLSGTTHVYIGGVEINIIQVTATSIVAGGNIANSGNITFTAPGGTGNAGYFTYIPQPSVAITSFTPAAAGQGATVTITGSNFKNVTAVSFGGVPSMSFKALSATSITAIVPNTATSGNVEVTTTGGKATVSGFTFLPKPTITSFSPTRAASGQVVTITGTNFDNVTAVKFNNVVPAQSFTVVSATTIIVTVGAGASGNVNVITTGGPASKTGFFYIQLPTITSFSPAQAGQGDVVTITGTNFADVTAVSIGGVAPISFTRLSPTSITARVGSGASGKITATSPAGTATSATDFTFLPPPANRFYSLAATEQTNILEDIVSYPNPFTSSLTLKLGDKLFKNLKVELLNYFGKVLYSKEFINQAGDVNLDLSNLEASQVYVLKLSADNTQYITKIAKK